MSGSRKICVVTGSRADYGQLRWLLHEIDTAPELKLELIVTGMHLSETFGLTYREIEQDGFVIAAKVPTLVETGAPSAVSESFAHGVAEIALRLIELTPDIMITFGDRYEMMAAAVAAHLQRILIAHIHGGEVTEGAFDDAMRHAMTKLAHLHFTAATAYQNRVIQLGEHPDRVFNFGPPGLDALDHLQLRDDTELQDFLEAPISRPFFLITLHPETLSPNPPNHLVNALTSALEEFPHACFVFTGVNADPGFNEISDGINQFAAKVGINAQTVLSLGQTNYLSALRIADVVIGNSSSGLIEAPAMGTPSVNIGGRQNGREMAESVISCAAEPDAVKAAIETALSPSFQKKAAKCEAVYKNSGASRKIREVLATCDLQALRIKKFHDINEVVHAH